MSFNKANCLICDEELVYLSENKKLNCEICGLSFESNVTCANGHYICDSCHSKSGYLYISRFCNDTVSKNPVNIATEVMKDSSIHMHGPEHHFLVAAALLAAYKNSGGDIDLEKSLNLAAQRAKNVPGGICGMWGSCGAAIGAGIFSSIATGSTPLAVKEWGMSNLMTSQCLYNISQNGGPRCCKRNTWLAISKAVEFAAEHMGVFMESPAEIKCSFSGLNANCKGKDCIFNPLFGK